MNIVKDISILKEFHTDVSLIQLRSDGIVKIQIMDNIEIDIIASRKIFEVVRSLATKKELLVLVIGGNGSTTTREAREFAGSDEASSVTIAEAVVTSSLPQRILVNFLLKFYNPKREMKLFNHEEDAVKWLYGYKKN
jgi:hypothetical protein